LLVLNNNVGKPRFPLIPLPFYYETPFTWILKTKKKQTKKQKNYIFDKYNFSGLRIEQFL